MVVIDRETLGGSLLLGKGVKIATTASIDTSGDVWIGDNVGIAEDVLILTHSHEFGHRGPITASSLAVGDEAFIGERAIILPQVRKIGDHALIGAGAVLAHDVEPYEVWAGNPARLVGMNR
jgi:acetyltransferase-like isoleucine patch superfamily enzyme